MKFSNTLNFMIKSGEGYRNTHYSSGVVELHKIINFELNELNNEDIFYFMKNNYDNYDTKCIEYKNNKIDYTINFVSNLLNTDSKNLKGVWLTTYQDVLDIYCDKESPENIDIEKVYIHENNMIPISDLDKDGALFVYVDDICLERVK